MSETPTLAERIETAAAKPAEVHADNFAAKSHPLPDMVAADVHLDRRRAAAAGGLPIRVFRGIPPGAC